MIAKLKVAVYARKSNPDEQQRGTETSVRRQLEDGRRFIARHPDWHLAGEYTDEAKSGVLGEDKRPGLKAVMDRVRAKAVDVVTMAANDRLARNQFEAMSLLYEFHKTGVRVIYFSDGREVDLKTEAGIFTEAAHNFGGAFKRVSDGSHMVAALMQKARNGHVHGGSVFGYTNVRVDGHVERRVDPEAAKVVRRIFREFVGGRTLKQIVTGLNPDRVRTPAHAGGWKKPGEQLDRTVKRGLTWSKATARAVLRRPLYRGIVVSRWKKSGETFEHVVPGLRIVDEPTWREANRLLAQATRVYLRHTSGRLWGKPTAGVESPYLLTGMLRCGLCGSVLGAESRPTGDGGKRLRVYWCRSNRHGRRTRGDVCPNNVVVPMRLLDDAVLACVEPYLTPDVIADAVAAAVKRAGSRPAVAAERTRLDSELKVIEAELARLVAFIKRGTASETVQRELAASEGRRSDLRAALDRLAQADAFRASAADLEQKVEAILSDWRPLTGKPVAQQRQLLRKLVPDRLTVTPHVDARRKWVDWAGDLAVAPIISGIAPAVGDVMPDGMDGRWWPQGDPHGSGPRAYLRSERHRGPALTRSGVPEIYCRGPQSPKWTRFPFGVDVTPLGRSSVISSHGNWLGMALGISWENGKRTEFRPGPPRPSQQPCNETGHRLFSSRRRAPTSSAFSTTSFLTDPRPTSR
jgi:DNA invertase Pin-like site-specific DNA recombinase